MGLVFFVIERGRLKYLNIIELVYTSVSFVLLIHKAILTLKRLENSKGMAQPLLSLKFWWPCKIIEQEKYINKGVYIMGSWRLLNDSPSSQLNEFSIIQPPSPLTPKGEGGGGG